METVRSKAFQAILLHDEVDVYRNPEDGPRCNTLNARDRLHTQQDVPNQGRESPHRTGSAKIDCHPNRLQRTPEVDPVAVSFNSASDSLEGWLKPGRARDESL